MSVSADRLTFKRSDGAELSMSSYFPIYNQVNPVAKEEKRQERSPTPIPEPITITVNRS